MTKPDESEEGAAAGGGVEPGGPGDVETAGETTAAAVIGADPAAEKPVGADTLVRVEGDPEPGGGRG